MIQQSIAVGGLSLVAAYLLQNGLITRENCDDVVLLATYQQSRHAHVIC